MRASKGCDLLHAFSDAAGTVWPMSTWSVGLGLLSAAIAVIAFVRYRERESASLTRNTALARELRALADDDEVRLAAVDEFEQTIYQRLFYASVVAPWVRSAAWALLGAVLAGAAALAIGPLDGVVATCLYIVAIVLVIVFGLAALACAGTALFHTATTPRVSFSESYGDAEDPIDEVAVETSVDKTKVDDPAPETTPSVDKS